MGSSAFTSDTEKLADFEALFRKNYDRLRQYVSRRAHSSRVDDVVASSFAIAWKKFGTVENPSLSWLIRIASFELANAERKARRTRNLIRVESIENIADMGIDEFDGTSVRIALDRLSKTDQEVLRLVHWDGLDRGEIAQVLGLSQNAVNIRYHRALKKFENEIVESTKTSTQERIVP